MNRTRSDEQNCRTDDAGFTLIELLVAMTLFGVLMVMTYGGLRFGTRAWETEQAHAGFSDEIRLAQTQLTRLLSDAYPHFQGDSFGHGRVAFDGTADRMAFLGPQVDAFGGAGRANFTVESVPEDRGLDLIIREKPELALSSEPVTSELLVRGFVSLHFEYFGSNPADQPPRWWNSWQNESELPLLIGITGQFASTDARVWPTLEIVPRINVDSNCVFDVITRRCRGR